MPIYAFILGVLAVWRLTHLLHAEDGPGDIFVKLRRLAGEGVAGQAMDCFLCLSLWTALPFALWLGRDWAECGVLTLALSAGAIAMDAVMTRLAPASVPATYVEDQLQTEMEKHNVQLWQQTPEHGDGDDDTAKCDGPARLRPECAALASVGVPHGAV